MKMKLTRAWTVLLISVSPAAWSLDYELDTVHTQIQFGVDHMGFSTSTGSFSDFSGSFSYDPEAPEASAVEVVIQTASLDMDNDTWNEHLSGEQWFNTAAHPTMEFTSTGVVSHGGNSLQVSGELTLLGETHPVVLDVSVNKIGMQMGTPKAGFSVSATIDRTQWGMSTFAPAIGTDVVISIQAEGAPVDTRLEEVVPPRAIIHSSSNIMTMQVNDLVSAKATIGQAGLMSQTSMKTGGFSPHHNHADEETITMISGRVKVLSPDGDFIIEPGDVINIEPYAEHQLEALEDSFFIEVFGPGRTLIGPKLD